MDPRIIPAVFVAQDHATATVVQGDILGHTARRDPQTGITSADVRLHGLLGTERNVPLLLTDNDAPGFNGGMLRFHPNFAMARNHKLAQQLLHMLRQQSQVHEPLVLARASYDLITEYNISVGKGAYAGADEPVAPPASTTQVPPPASKPQPEAAQRDYIKLDGHLSLSWHLARNGEMIITGELVNLAELIVQLDHTNVQHREVVTHLASGLTTVIGTSKEVIDELTHWLGA